MCDCSCDYDPPSVIANNDRKARKEHKCSECGRVIQAGETYHHTWGVWDGSPATFRWCGHCAAAIQVVMDVSDCHCFCYGDIWENLQEIADSCKSLAVWRIYVGVRHRWRIRRGSKAGKLMPIPVVRSLATNP